MGIATRDIYKRDKFGKYFFVKRDIVNDIPMTIGGWQRSNMYDKRDGFKVKVYKKLSKSKMSFVPYKVIAEDLLYGKKYVYTNFKQNPPRLKGYIKCKNINCKSRW